MDTHSRPVLFFDGVCNLCNRSVQFVIRHDKKEEFFFAPLQGIAGKEVLAHLKVSNDNAPDSVVLYYKDKYYTRSDAVLQVMQILGGKWRLFAALRIIPAFMRNGVYRLIAGSRYKLFGKMDSCIVPTPSLKARFLD